MSAATTVIRSASTQPAGFILAIAVSAILGVAVGTALDDAFSTTGADAVQAVPMSGSGPAGMPQAPMRHGFSSQPQVE